MSKKDHSSGKGSIKVENKLKQKGIRLLFEDIKNLRWAVIAVIVYLLLLKKITGTSCIIVAMTGFPCPGCGLTRAGVRLMHGDVHTAFLLHPFIYGILLYGTAFGINRYVLGRTMGKVLKGSLLLLTASMCLFYIYRMIRYFPGNPPMSYYRYNFLRELFFFVNNFFLK